MLLSILCDYWLLPFLGSFILGSILGWLLGRGKVRKETIIEEKIIYKDKIVYRDSPSGTNAPLNISSTSKPTIESKKKETKRPEKISSKTIKDSGQLELKVTSDTTTPTKATSLISDKKTKIGEDLKDKKAAPKKKSKPSIYTNLSADNLQIVEGIGPKMDEVLKKNGVNNWGELGSQTAESLRAILDKENPKRYRIIDPAPWPSQAKLADENKWEELVTLQKNLGGNGNETDAKVEKILIKMGVIKRWKQDDLKAIEGIGPKIEGLLKEAGFSTWYSVSKAPVNELQAVLDKAGPRYKLAKPHTWPKQAEYAHNGQWDDLQEYQEELVGGK